MSRIVGIDLGTTNSLVAYVKDGVPQVIRDKSGDALDSREWKGEPLLRAIDELEGFIARNNHPRARCSRVAHRSLTSRG